jgi:hypothetical protein
MTSEELHELVELEKQIKFFEKVISSAECGSGIYIYSGDMSRAEGREVSEGILKNKILKLIREELENMREKFGKK